MYPKYPVSGTIRALLKGPLGGPGWVWGLGAQGSGVHSRTCLAKLLLLKLYRVSGLWPHGSGLAETLVLVLLPLRVACPTSNWKSSLTSTCYAQGGGPLLSSSSMVYFYIYIYISLSLPVFAHSIAAARMLCADTREIASCVLHVLFSLLLVFLFRVLLVFLRGENPGPRIWSRPLTKLHPDFRGNPLKSWKLLQ